MVPRLPTWNKSWSKPARHPDWPTRQLGRRDISRRFAGCEAALANAQSRAVDERNRAEGYLSVIRALEGKIANAQSVALDEKSRAEGYATVIRDLEARATAAEQRLGSPPHFPALDQSPENLHRGLDKYLGVLPDRNEIASQITLLGSSAHAESPTITATLVYLHFLMGDYDLAYKRLERLDVFRLASVIPNPRRTWYGFVWLLCRIGNRQAADSQTIASFRPWCGGLCRATIKVRGERQSG